MSACDRCEEMKGVDDKRTHTRRTFVHIYMVDLYMVFAEKVVVELVLVLLTRDSLRVDCLYHGISICSTIDNMRIFANSRDLRS
jgi:hypothetical protein